MEFGKKQKGINSKGSERLCKKAEIPSTRDCEDLFRSFLSGTLFFQMARPEGSGRFPGVLFACFF